MARRISIVNHKGGVAKSTTAVNLAVLLAQLGHRTLLVDFDPSGGATDYLGLLEEKSADNTKRQRLPSSPDLLAGSTDVVQANHLRVQGFDFIPSTRRLAFMEPKLIMAGPEGHHRLATALNQFESQYEYMLVDSPPNLGILMNNVVIAAPEVIITVPMNEGGAPQALDLYTHLGELRQTLQPKMQILGVLATLYDRRTVASRELLPKLGELFGEKLFKSVIHHSRSVDNANGLGWPIALVSPKSEPAQDYLTFTQEVIARG